MFNFTANAQTTCPDTKWRYELNAPIPYQSVDWLQNGTTAINRWSNQGHLSPGPILTVASTEPVGQTHPNFELSPASIRLLTNTYNDPMDINIPTFEFGESFILFSSESPNVIWDVGKIKAVDNLGGNYDANDLTRNVSAGLAFYDANGPTFQQTVNGGSREVFRIINGNMGVGTIDPLNKFVVQTNEQWESTMVSIDQHNNNPSIRLYRSTGSPNACPTGMGITEADGWWIEVNNDWQTTGEYSPLVFKTKNEPVCPYDNNDLNTVVSFTRDGRVLIGDLKYNGTEFENVNMKLSVDGGIATKEVLITMDDWADYVFEDDYYLMDLNELESSIKTNGHLPGIPSSEQVRKNGVAVGEMQKQMMQKIEELTLYVIQLKKENDEIKQELNSIKQGE